MTMSWIRSFCQTSPETVDILLYHAVSINNATLFSCRHIVKSNLFAPVVDAFVRNNGRYNLLESAILELFEFIKIEDIKSLYTYFVENFGKIFDDVQYVQTFKTLKNKYDQQQDRLKEKEKGNLDRYGSGER